MKPRLTLKKLHDDTVSRFELLESEFKLFKETLQRQINALDKVLRGGEGREFESLLFRVIQLEQLVQLKTHVKPVTKKQMKEIRSLLKANE